MSGLVEGFVFPNEHHIHWSLMIVTYPYITGIIAGAFIVSSLYHVFHVKALKPVSRFALVFALAFGFCCTWPLLNHLGRPERCFNIMLTPHPTSAMAGFGFIYSAYMVVLLLEILFLYRGVFAKLLPQTTGFKATLYRLLTFGNQDLSPATLQFDHKVTSWLALIGIPMACILHGYVGFIFGSVKAVEWWSTPLMPIIFLLSACVSGISGIILGYLFVHWVKGRAVDEECLSSLVKYLWGFLIIDVVFELLEVGVHAYLRKESWHHLHELLFGPLYVSFWVMQVFIFSFIPLVVLGVLSLANVRGKALQYLSAISSIMLLIQVYCMRWNVVVGGQMMSKSGRGFVFYHPEFFEKEGILPTIIILIAPIIILFVLSKIFPLWLGTEEVKTYKK
ncbi:NrfD/PsrC family molybdoenzyme membrane anchor subunit [Thermosulfurimonas dismutans]|uniref:Tetrathionate reductase subunit C n=1 Tax=Thermosulfurimonas dismutans TaxID=999894 RepID=A0A179D5R5_9BACT|nr:NrfD/PsrC family molybdoenzyme membrane anchor subunit [Thermosulfurimonas dismutans]OAQ21386.1 Tetrathionate reductase subunit C [Thermosulfurimonas dismutans]